jgi:hypothetical protein
MTRYKVALLGIIVLAVLGVAGWLFLANWDPKRPPPPSLVGIPPCRYQPKAGPTGPQNTCLERCGPPYPAGQNPVQCNILGSGEVWLCCCPIGHTLDFDSASGARSCRKP